MIAIAVRGRLAEDELGNDPEAIGHRGPGRPHLLEPGRRSEALGHDYLRACDEAADELHEQRIGVEERHADEAAIARGEREGLRQPEAEHVAVAVGHEDALRRSRRPRRVQDHRDVTRRGRRERHVARCPKRPQLGEHEALGPRQTRGRRCRRVADDHQRVGPSGARGDVAQVRGEPVLDHHDAGLGIVKLMLQECAAETRIDRNPHGAELRRGKQHADCLGAVADQAEDAIACPYPERGQR